MTRILYPVKLYSKNWAKLKQFNTARTQRISYFSRPSQGIYNGTNFIEPLNVRGIFVNRLMRIGNI